LKVAAVCDLKGFGEKEGPAVACDWAPPSLVPLLLPWLVLLGLLALPINRSARAWAIWLPLGLLLVMSGTMTALFSGLPSEMVNLLCDAVDSLGFGAAAVWLLAPHLGGAGRFLTFLKMLVTQGGFTLLAYGAGQDWSTADFEPLGLLIPLGVLALALTAALSLAGCNCRRRFHPVRLLVWLAVWLVAGLTLVLLPFALPVVAMGGAEVLAAFGVSALAGTGISLAVSLPFLVLAFSNRLYRDRLSQLLRLAPATAPSSIPPKSVSTPIVRSTERTVP
jgi:hypothetical protein